METKQEEPQITLTDSAVNRVLNLIQTQNREGEGVKVRVEAGGCSGFKYNLNFGKPTENDIVIEDRGVKIITDGESMPFLIGSKIEFVEDLHGSRFEVINPNEASQCGCGSSVGF